MAPSGNGAAANATTPGKNGLIVFSADTGAGFQLYTIKPNGSGLRQLTNLNNNPLAADWSPDGRRIALGIGTEGHDGIAIMNADGSGLHDLTPTGFQGDPAFTPTATTWSTTAVIAQAARASSSSVTTAPAAGA
jgi:Tol biopolymer transport system component